jgi:hypothetical protein
LIFSIGIRMLLDDLASTLGPERLILASPDDICILSNDPNALEVGALFASPTFYPTQYGEVQDNDASGGEGGRAAAPRKLYRTHSGEGALPRG